MKLRKVMAAALAAAISFSCSIPAFAATVTEEKEMIPDLVYYRNKAKETFDGEIDIRDGKAAVSNVALKGENPALYIAGFDDKTVQFDSLYKSAMETLLVTRDEKETEVDVGLAVYDRVSLEQDKGSVTLTVKNNRTLKAVAGAKYSLYKKGKSIEGGLATDANGQITVSGLHAGEYELRPEDPPKGYLATNVSIPFTIGGIELSGGKDSIRTTEGKKISADENEILVAGLFSEDAVLEGVKESQISLVTLTFSNYGAVLEKGGKAIQKNFSAVKEAEEFLNAEKNAGRICGPVEITYTLKSEPGRSTCNFTQYIEAETPQNTTPTPVPTPTPSYPQGNNNSQGNGNGGNNSSGTKPTATPKPIATPTPAAPKQNNLSISVFTDNGELEGFVFQLTGATSDGTAYQKDYKTDEKGEINVIVPAGVYNVAPKDTNANKGYELPPAQPVQIGEAGSSYLSFNFISTERDITLTVIDDDGNPLENVSIGLFPANLLVKTDADTEVESSDATDVSQKIENVKEDEAYQELLDNPYEKKNALKIAKTDSEGRAVFSGMSTEQLLAVPITTPDGYADEQTPVDILNGLETEFTVLCEYVKVELSAIHPASEKAPLDAEAVLIDPNGKELTSWIVESEPHALIRVPDGQYTLRLTYGEETQELPFEVTKEKAQQKIELETTIRGNVPVEQAETKNASTLPFLIAGLAISFTVIGLGCYVAVKKHRKHKGGIQ